jgi:ABC-type polysaccharide/polyol phosphate export permease
MTPERRRSALRLVLGVVLAVNAAIFAAPAFVGQGLQPWEWVVAAILAGLAVVFAAAGLKGLRGAG